MTRTLNTGWLEDKTYFFCLFLFQGVFSCCLEPRVSLLGAVHGPSDIAAGNGDEEQDGLEQEPSPVSLLLARLDTTPRVAARAGPGSTVRGAATDAVEVLRLDGDDIMVVAEFTGLRGEAEVRDRGDGNVGFGGG